MDDDEKAAAALLQVDEVKDEFGTVSEKRNEFKGKLREREAESGRRLIRFNTLLVKQARMDKVLPRGIGQSDYVFDVFVNRLGGELVNSLRARLKRVYSDNLVECLVALTQAFWSATISVSR